MDTTHPHVQALLQTIRNTADPSQRVRDALASHEVHPTALFATGKASLTMASAALALTAPRMGVVTAVPDLIPTVELPEGIEVLPADHPLPSHRNLQAARRVEAFMDRLGEQDTLLALISGGGSAHLCSPVPPLTLDDLRRATDALLRAGATIQELNAVRKHAERLKGGNLARLAFPARVHCLVVSDVMGDRLDTISSGPFAPDPTTYADALEALRTHGLLDLVPALTRHLEAGLAGRHPETPKVGDPCFARVESHIIASNAQVVRACAAALRETGYEVLEERTQCTGQAGELGRRLARRAIDAARNSPRRAMAIVMGGETTVDTKGASGLGGRMQELALAAAVEIEGEPGITVLAVATDGIDGPTDAAGAVVDGKACARMRARGVDPRRALESHDSYHALDAARSLLRTGPTGTNVNDIAVALVTP